VIGTLWFWEMEGHSPNIWRTWWFLEVGSVCHYYNTTNLLFVQYFDSNFTRPLFRHSFLKQACCVWPGKSGYWMDRPWLWDTRLNPLKFPVRYKFMFNWVPVTVNFPKEVLISPTWHNCISLFTGSSGSPALTPKMSELWASGVYMSWVCFSIARCYRWCT
jgi:hypothetical protein